MVCFRAAPAARPGDRPAVSHPAGSRGSGFCLPSTCACRRSASWFPRPPRTDCSTGMSAQAIQSIGGVRQSGVRGGNWLTREQARDLLACPDVSTSGRQARSRHPRRPDRMRAAPQRARRARKWKTWSSATAAGSSRICLGKGKRVRTVPVPAWVKVAVDVWTSREAEIIKSGALFRRVRNQDRTGRVRRRI